MYSIQTWTASSYNQFSREGDYDQDQERQTKDEEQQEPLAQRHRTTHLLSKTRSRQASCP
jgi:hypothetical protein